MVTTKTKGSKKPNDEASPPIPDFPTFVQPMSQTPAEEPKKKRGRKPKGGKIVSQDSISTTVEVETTPNVVLHLKCHLKDLDQSSLGGATQSSSMEAIEGYSAFTTKAGDLDYQILERPRGPNDDACDTEDRGLEMTSRITIKLKELSRCLHSNDISDKKSACFWCTCEFDNPPISIPKYELNGIYHVYGCFCSPECAVAYLMEQRVDTSTKFERYALLNHLYCKLYDYKRNIQPAPDPHYTLDKYYGNLTIQEYRKLLKSERLLLIVDKPLTRVLPELHQDAGEYALSAGGMGMAGGNAANNTKFRLKRKTAQPNKRSVVNHTFGLTTN